jgi:hypothetical protein
LCKRWWGYRKLNKGVNFLHIAYKNDLPFILVTELINCLSLRGVASGSTQSATMWQAHLDEREELIIVPFSSLA